MKGMNAYDRFSVISGIIMVFVYCAVGVFVFVSDLAFTNLSQGYRKIFGILIVLYGFYRAYKAYQKYVEIKTENQNQDSDENEEK